MFVDRGQPLPFGSTGSKRQAGMLALVEHR